MTNYNNLGVSRIYFHDPITGNQVYEPNSLEVTRGTINHNGQFQATTSDPYKGNQVGKNYLKVTDPAPTSENQGTLTIDLGTDEEYIQGWNVTGAPMVFQIQFKTSLKIRLCTINLRIAMWQMLMSRGLNKIYPLQSPWRSADNLF